MNINFKKLNRKGQLNPKKNHDKIHEAWYLLTWKKKHMMLHCLIMINTNSLKISNKKVHYDLSKPL